MLRNYAPLLLGASLLSACSEDDGDASETVARGVTFSREIAPLLQQHCQRCHHDGGVAPFPLTTYEETQPFADAIVSAVTTGRMPHGVSIRVETGCGDPDTFEGPRRLTQEEIDTIAAWVEDDAPEGDPAELPAPLTFEARQWTLGEPDRVIANARDGFRLPAGLDRDVFRRFVIPTGFDTERHLTGFEARPGVTGGERLHRIVHHVTLWVEPACGSVAVEEQFAGSDPEIPGPGFEGDFGSEAFLVGMWFPGSAPLSLRDGLGISVPAGACIVMEVHYSGDPEGAVDKTLVGLHFAEDEVDAELVASLVKNEEFTIPANAVDYEIEASHTLEAPVMLHAITPHMHQIGTDFDVTLELPGEAPSCLADVAWDFEHQGTYRLRTPLDLPAGTTVRTHCTYDNSTANPNQIHEPPRDIEFGKSADLEMCQLTIGTTAR